MSAVPTVLRQVFPFFWSTFTVKIAVSLHSTQLLTSLIVQRNLPRPKVFGGRWSRVLEGLISSSLQVARLLKNTLRGFFQIPASTPNAGWVCCWFSPLLREVFLRVLRFSPLLKNQHFQIPIRSGTHRHVSTSSYELLNAPWVNKLQITTLDLTKHKQQINFTEEV